jgi:hypothetical protein
VTIERGGHVIGRLPYVVRGRARVRVLTMPPLTATLGPWVRRSDARQARALSREMHVLRALEAALPRADVFSQQFSPTMLKRALPLGGLPD